MKMLRTSVVFTVLVMLSEQSLRAGPVPISGGTNTVRDEASTDYHIHLTSDAAMTINIASLMMGNNQFVGHITNNNSLDVTIDWTVKIPANTLISYAWTGTQVSRNFYKETSDFTPPASPTDVPNLGWLVTNDGHVFLDNAYSSDISFSNLLFQFPSDLSVNTMLSLVNGPPFGVPGTITSGIVPAGSELLVGQFNLGPGELLTDTYDAQFTDSTFSNLTARNANGHGQATPEPSAFILFCLGSLCLFLLRYLNGRARIGSIGVSD